MSKPPDPVENADDSQSDPEPHDRLDYLRALGSRLRAVRQQKHLSLRDVATKSDDDWKAVVLGSYERGDRSISAARLASLAHLYEVSTADLLPPQDVPDPGEPGALSGMVVDLDSIDGAPAPAALFVRYLRSVQRSRGDTNGRWLTLRADDVRALAAIYGLPASTLTEAIHGWNVLAEGPRQTRITPPSATSSEASGSSNQTPPDPR
ncbi:helix-turn-helix domain-containing protein [Jatrophihabitans sp. DSM 45814]